MGKLSLITNPPIRIEKTPKDRFIPKRGYRPDLDSVHDSKMEANVHRFYKYLENEYGKIKVEYEPKGFKFTSNVYGIYRYIPDFYISSAQGDWYIEVKGKMDANALAKHRLATTQFRGVRIYFVTVKEYSLIKKYYSNKISNWE